MSGPAAHARRRPAAPRFADAATAAAPSPTASASSTPADGFQPGDVRGRGRQRPGDGAASVTGLGEVDAEQSLFRGRVAVWLWGTVLFANFAEALAEGRGKAQAADLRATRSTRRPAGSAPTGSIEEVPSTELELDDRCEVVAGETIPCDGEVVEGVATVDESVITGESAPVIRESGGDRSAVTGGTRVLSDRIVVCVTARAGETFLDRMIALVEGAERQRTPNEIALSILLSGMTIVFLVAVVSLQPFAAYSGAVAGRRRARGAARRPDPDDDRRTAVGDRDRRHGPARAPQRACDERPRRRGGRRLLDAADRQDRDDHARQPPRDRLPSARRQSPGDELTELAARASLADETPEGRSIVELAAERLPDAGLEEAGIPDGAPRRSRSPPRRRMSGLDLADGTMSAQGRHRRRHRLGPRGGR